MYLCIFVIFCLLSVVASAFCTPLRDVFIILSSIEIIFLENYYNDPLGLLTERLT